MELEVLSNFMARIPDKIKSIDGSREMLKLAVRVTNLWFVGTPNKSEQAKMIIVDSEENSTYVMHNFKVVKNDSQFRVCEHEYKLVFIRVNVVREADLHELPFKEFRFVEFGNVVVGNFVADLLVGEPSHNLCSHFDHNFFSFFNDLFLFSDIIGVVDQNEGFEVMVYSNFSPSYIYLFILSRILFAMLDDGYLYLILMNGEVLSCTHWENYCMQFLAYLNERGNDGLIIIILTHARIKDVQGSYLASVSNSFKASKLLINEHVLEIQEFRERLLDLGVEVSPIFPPGDQGSSQLSRASQLSSNDAFLSKPEAKTISEINGISECYPACIQCHRKTDIQTGPFTCGCGKDNDQPVLRYRVEVMVSQNNDSSKFLLWDRECAELIGEIADEVNRVKIEDGDVDLNASPQALDRLLGYVLAFKVRIQSKFRNVIVLRYSNELDLINVVLDMLADTEVCSKIDASNVDCNNAMHPESDHDPVAGFPLMPKKCLSSDEVDDELGSSQISPAQLSHFQYAKRSNSAKARINRKRIMQQKRHPHAQSSSQPTINYTSEYDSSGSNFLTAYEDCQSPTNQPVINTEGYSDLGDQHMQCKYCNAQIIQGHIVLSLTHMLDEHNSHAKSFRMASDRLANDEANNIKLQLIVARGKDGHVYNMPNVPEIAALIVGNFHLGSKRDIIVETQNGELQRIHELHPSYLPLQYPLLLPYGEDGYRADILHRYTSSNKKRKSNEAETLLHSRKLFQQFIVEGYTMVEYERLSYIRNNQKKLRVDKYCSLQNSLDTGIAKGLTKGKRVILPSMFVGSPRYMETIQPTRKVSTTLYAKSTTLARKPFLGVKFDMRKKAQAIQKHNIAPHVLSHEGYEYLENKERKKLEEAAQSGSTDTVIDPPSPIRQHMKWKMARTKKTGQMTSEAAKEIAEKIESLEEQASYGFFVAIGRPEHRSRVGVVGVGVTIKKYFGLAPRTSHMSSSMGPKDLEQLMQQIRDYDSTANVILQPNTVPRLALPPEPEVGPSATCASTKESCVDPLGNDPDTGDLDKCRLYIEENPPCLVALGRVYEGSTIVHNIPLLHDQVKVGVEEVRDADASIPVPTEEVKLVGQTLNTFFALPTHLVKGLSEQGVVGPTKPADRPHHDVDDPLYLMTLTILQLFLKPLQVMWDAIMFGVFNEDFPLYIKYEDLSEIAHGGQCLSISFIQLWILHMNETSIRAGNADVYGFLKPQSIQRSGQLKFESESYIKNWMQNSK
ncbi:Replication protein A DNA-binding subunit B [Glycine soja]